jgi:nucleoside-diphosphate-sugar epimerase
MSLRELSAWCAEKISAALAIIDPNQISSDQSSRPFDIPWAILDPDLAREAWGWKPTTTLPQILDEIRSHAESNPTWLDLVTA